MIADRVYISTNAFFSLETLQHLNNYSHRTGLDIKTINLKDIISWVNQNPNWPTDNEKRELINNLREMASKINITKLPSLPAHAVFTSPSGELIGLERKMQLEKAKKLMNKMPSVLICSGQSGMGKTTFFKMLVASYDKYPYEAKTIDLHKYPTSREVFIAILSLVWGLEFAQLCNFGIAELAEITKYLGDELFPPEQQASLISLISRSQQEYEKNAMMNDTMLIDYISRIFNPILKRVSYIITVENAHDTTAHSLQFLIRIIKSLEYKVIFLIEERTDFDLSPSLSQVEWKNFFSDLRRTKIFLHDIKLNPLTLDDSKEYIRRIDPTCTSEKSHYLAMLFGGVPLYISTGIDLVRNSTVYELWGAGSNSVIEHEIESIGHIEQAILRFYSSSDLLIQRLVVLLTLFDGSLNTDALTFFFHAEDIKILCASLHGSIYVYINESYAEIRHGLYLKCTQNLGLAKGTYLLEITNEANNYVCTRLSDNPTKWKKRLYFARLTNNAVSIHDFWQDYANHLKSLGEEHLVLDLLYFVYENNNHDRIDLTESQRYYLLSMLTETKILVGQGHTPEVLSYVSEMEASIKLERLPNNELALRKAILFHNKCNIFLSGGDYENLKLYASYGMSINPLELQHLSWFYRFYALALKHLVGLNKCLEFLEAHKEGMELDANFQFVLNTHRASKYAGWDPQEALKYFEEIRHLYQQLPKRVSLHNEHNIATMLFMCTDINKAEEICQNTWLKAYRTNDRIEEGRSLHLLGCIYWYKGDTIKAIEWFKKSYTMFESITQKTHVWRPAANLAGICFECQNSYHAEGFFYASKAAENLLEYHIPKINSTILADNDYSILYIGALTVLYYIWKYDSESEYINKLLTKITLHDFMRDFNIIKNSGGLADVLKNSSYFIKGRVILKV